jgi:hypothetical protein
VSDSTKPEAVIEGGFELDDWFTFIEPDGTRVQYSYARNAMRIAHPDGTFSPINSTAAPGAC